MQLQVDPLQCDEVPDVSDIETPTLWLQRLVISGGTEMIRVGGNDSCADLGTNHLDYQTMNKHLKFSGMRFAEGRSKNAPMLEFCSTSIPMIGSGSKGLTERR